MPNLIPEDSMLRRHYLTEIKSQMDKHFDEFLAQAILEESSTPDDVPYDNRFPVFATAGFIFLLVVLFL